MTMQDSFHRELRYLRISVTDRCNLRCRYCMPEEGICKQSHADILRYEEITTIASVMAGLGVRKIRLTGGEPLVRKGLSSLLESLNGIAGIEDVSLTTNGLLLEEQLDRLIAAGLRRVNISLDSLNPAVYAHLTRGGDLARVLRAVELCRERGLSPVKLNVVVIRGMNAGEINDFIRLAEGGLHVRFIELMPLGEAAGWSRDHFVDLGAVFGGRDDLTPVLTSEDNSEDNAIERAGYSGPCRYFRRKENGGLIGIITPISNHFCGTCNRLRLTADGMLRACLHDNRETDLKPFLHDPAALRGVILDSVTRKPARHAIQNKDVAFFADGLDAGADSENSGMNWAAEMRNQRVNRMAETESQRADRMMETESQRADQMAEQKTRNMNAIGG